MLVYLPVVLFFIFLIFVILVNKSKCSTDSEFFGFLAGLSGFLGLLACVPICINYTITASQLAIINKQEPIIAHYRNYIERLDKKIMAAAKEGRQTMFTANHDTPVKSMVEAQLKAEDDMLSAAKARDEAEIAVEAIRLGLYGKVVDWITEPKEK